jgi:hypothetical protein
LGKRRRWRPWTTQKVLFHSYRTATAKRAGERQCEFDVVQPHPTPHSLSYLGEEAVGGATLKGLALQRSLSHGEVQLLESHAAAAIK